VAAAQRLVSLLAAHGLQSGQNERQLYVHRLLRATLLATARTARQERLP